MHRSGTSCLAGSLERSGLFLGDVVRSSRHNPRGNHEFKRARQLNDRILIGSGGSWSRPPRAVTVGWWQRLAIKRIAHGLVKREPCGLKDPRLLLFLETWLSVVESYALVGTFRHPAAFR